MRNSTNVIVLFGLTSLSLATVAPVTAQSPALTHLGHVMDVFQGTPDGQGLLPTAVAEADVIVTHAGLMLRDLSDLAAMKTHAGHVLNAADPAEMDNGPGLGYGLKAAATGVARHVRLAAASDGASASVMTHATHVAASAGNTVFRADRIIELAKAIRDAESAYVAGVMVRELNVLATALMDGVDSDEDGTVGWQEGEGGLTIVQTHMGLMQTGAAR